MSSLIFFIVFCLQAWSQNPTSTPTTVAPPPAGSGAPAPQQPGVPPPPPMPVPTQQPPAPAQQPPEQNAIGASPELNSPEMNNPSIPMDNSANNPMNPPGDMNSPGGSNSPNMNVNENAKSAHSILPSEVITINPYYKNKPRLGKMVAELQALPSNQSIIKLEADFGDCKKCSRGVSIKSKIGIRFYGDSLNKLRVSRKNSTSIKLQECPYQKQLDSPMFSCEFSHKNQNYRMVIRIEP